MSTQLTQEPRPQPDSQAVSEAGLANSGMKLRCAASQPNNGTIRGAR